MQVACAVLVFFSTAQELAAQSRPDKRARASLGRELHDSLTVILRQAIADRAFPGAYAVVGDSRGILAEHGSGRLDWKKSRKPDRHTLWDLASLTKVLGTATMMAQLVERGAIDLDAPVQRYVPEWTGPWKDRVTVRHLLTHASGLPSFRPYDQQTHNPDSLAMLLFTTQLERAPGEQMVYSDIGAFMMGVVAERVSGQRVDSYVAKHVFGPLRMRETMFNPRASLRKRIAPTEVVPERGGLVHGLVHDERAHFLGGVATHAGLFSTAHDVSRFARMMLRGGELDGVRVLRPETVRLFTAYVDSLFSNRALGWQKPELAVTRYKTPAPAWAGALMGTRAFGHTGFTGTSIAVDPELDLFIVLLSNRVNPTRDNPRITEVRRRLADAVVAAVRRRESTINAERP